MTTEATQELAPQPRPSVLRRGLTRAGIVGAFAVGPSELALSDTMFAKAGNAIGKYTSEVIASPVLAHAAEYALTSGVVAGESIAVGGLLLLNKNLRGAYEAFDEYSTREHEVSKPRKILSTIINAPYAGIVKIGKKIEKGGEKLTSSESSAVQKLGAFAVDVGKSNVMTTTGVILTELGEKDTKVDMRRVGRVSTAFAASWIPTYIGVQQGYRALDEAGPVGRGAQRIIGAVGHFIDRATTINPLHPSETPLGDVTMPLVMTALGVTGWRVANFLDRQRAEKNSQQPAAGIEQ